MERSPPDSSYRLEILLRDDLLNRPKLLEDVVSLVNQAYLEHTMFNGQCRFDNNQQLLSELGSDGICAALLRVAASGEAAPIATACTRPCREDEDENDNKVRNGKQR